VVIPDGIVQAQRLVTPAPLVARAGVAIDDDRRDIELAQPRRQRDTALTAADDEHLGLSGVAELGGLLLAVLQPRRAIRVDAVLGALGPGAPAALLVAL